MKFLTALFLKASFPSDVNFFVKYNVERNMLYSEADLPIGYLGMGGSPGD